MQLAGVSSMFCWGELPHLLGTLLQNQGPRRAFPVPWVDLAASFRPQVTGCAGIAAPNEPHSIHKLMTWSRARTASDASPGRALRGLQGENVMLESSSAGTDKASLALPAVPHQCLTMTQQVLLTQEPAGPLGMETVPPSAVILIKGRHKALHCFPDK